MREAFHDQLDGIFADLSEICGQVEIAVREATKALMTGDSWPRRSSPIADRSSGFRCSRSSASLFSRASAAGIATTLRFITRPNGGLRCIAIQD